MPKPRNARDHRPNQRNEREMQARNRALHALAAIRRGVSISRAARENGVSTRTIKRYAGRRLYNASTVTYVTPEEIAAMADDDEDIVVRDAGTGEDITQLILQQQRRH